jgi:hypothetical protein
MNNRNSRRLNGSGLLEAQVGNGAIQWPGQVQFLKSAHEGIYVFVKIGLLMHKG